jgi:hypothetical protein
MSILKASCVHCASDAGRNGFECSSCAELPHVKTAEMTFADDSVIYVSECPNCKRANKNASWDGLMLCDGCQTEYVCLNPDQEVALAREKDQLADELIDIVENNLSLHGLTMGQATNDAVKAYVLPSAKPRVREEIVAAISKWGREIMRTKDELELAGEEADRRNPK